MVDEIQKELEEGLSGHVADHVSTFLNLQHVLSVFLVEGLEVEERRLLRQLLGGHEDGEALLAEVFERHGRLTRLILEVHDQFVGIRVLFRDKVVKLVNLHDFARISFIIVQILLLITVGKINRNFDFFLNF